MSFREIPQPISDVLAAARRIDPAHGVFVTVATEAEGPTWKFHPHKRWLILRDLDDESIIRGVACALLARTAHFGTGAVTEIPEHLRVRFQQAREALIAALDREPRAEGEQA
jgi:hypothetical protein